MSNIATRLMIVACSFLIATGAVQAAGSDPVPTEAVEITNARSALKAKEFATAETLLRKAVANDPKSAEAWNLLGFALRKQERLEEAEKYYDEALALVPKHLGALEYLGMLYVMTGRIDEAKGLLERIDDECFFTCEEYEELEVAIKTGKAE